MQAIEEQAHTGYPQEVCGAWFVTATGTWGIRSWQNQYTGPKAHHLFWVHPLDVLAILEAQDRQELTWLGMYHSHPKAPPILSTQDLDALVYQNTPLYPDLHLLIVGVSVDMALSSILYGWQPEPVHHKCSEIKNPLACTDNPG